jgi:Omp85 superfamily domain
MKYLSDYTALLRRRVLVASGQSILEPVSMIKRHRRLALTLLSSAVIAAESSGVRLDAPQEQLADGSTSLAAVSLTGKDATAKSDIIGAPVPFYNPALGAGLGGFVGYLFPYDKTDRESPPSVIGVGGFATDNGSWGAFAGHVGYADSNSKRWTVVGGYSELTYHYYGSGYSQGATGHEVEIDQQVTLGLAEELWLVAPDWFFGPRLMATHSEVSLHQPPQTGNSAIDDFLSQVSVTTAISPGVHLQFDSRDNTFSPGSGTLFDLMLMVSPEVFGSTTNYAVTKLAANQYLRLTPAQVLAFRIAGKYAGENAPFYVQPSAGGPEGLRGYVPGQYLDHLLLSGQAEWRWMTFSRLGVTAFAGAVAVGEDFQDLAENPLLPAVGAGIILRLSDKFPVSMRLDAAWGRDSQTIYFSVGEAF